MQGPDGNLWFLDLGGNKVARLTTAGTLTEFPIPPHPENPYGSSPESIAAGPDGALWLTEGASKRIGRITLDGRITEFKLPGVDHIPSDIVAGPDGALWFLEPTQNLFGRITLDRRITEFSFPCAARSTAGTPTTSSDGPCEVVNITSAPDGALWFSEKWRNAGRIMSRATSSSIRWRNYPQLEMALKRSLSVPMARCGSPTAPTLPARGWVASADEASAALAIVEDLDSPLGAVQWWNKPL